MSTTDLAARDDAFVPVAPHWYLTNTGGVVLNGVLALTTHKRRYAWLFWGAVVIHIAEALYAYWAAREAGFTRSAARWALQTLAVGFPSLIALHQAKQA